MLTKKNIAQIIYELKEDEEKLSEFLSSLIHHHGAALLDSIDEEINKLDTHRLESQSFVLEYAYSLDESEMEFCTKKLGAQRDVIIASKNVKTLIAGYRAQYRYKIYDVSFKNHIEQLEKYLLH